MSDGTELTDQTGASGGTGLESLVSGARSLLFVPGDRPERFNKAVASGADLIVIDLEDAVPAEGKELARASVAEYLGADPAVAVRVNGVDTPWHEADLAALEGQPRVVVLPKAEDALTVARLVDGLAPGSVLVALVETARGVLAAAELARVRGVCRLALGTIDLGADLGVDPEDRDAMATARRHVVLASASAGLAPPFDGVTVAVDDRVRLEDDVRYSRRLGFAGKLCIHPRQVEVVHNVLQPSESEIHWAAAVLAAADRASGRAVLLEGRMVDKPVIDRARRLVDQSEAHAVTREAPNRG